MKLYLHPTTKRWFDYREHIGTEKGYMWSTRNEPGSALGFEQGDFAKKLAEARKDAEGSTVEVLEGCPIERHVNMNPHGLI